MNIMIDVTRLSTRLKEPNSVHSLRSRPQVPVQRRSLSNISNWRRGRIDRSGRTRDIEEDEVNHNIKDKHRWIGDKIVKQWVTGFQELNFVQTKVLDVLNWGECNRSSQQK
jgi:hypothetical protein